MSGIFGFGSLSAFSKTNKEVNKFDSTAGDALNQIQDVLSPIDARSMLADIQAIRGAALAIALAITDALSSPDGLPDGVIPSDFLDDLMLDALGVEDDEDVDPFVNQLLTANIMDALSSLGVSDDVIQDIFGDDVEAADAALEVASETVIANLPNDGDDLDKFADGFVYGFGAEDVMDMSEDDDQDPTQAAELYDDTGEVSKKAPLTLGGKTTRKVMGRNVRYKAVRAIRHGKVTVVNKRLANQKVRLTSKQKQSVRKMQVKAQKFGAIKHRVASLKKGMKRNLYPDQK